MKVIRFLLFPFALIYDLVTTVRNRLFDYGIFKQYGFQIPVIAVGNLSVGGTGKTPQIEYIIRLLKNKYKVATLSRGYKRKTKGYQEVTSSSLVTDVGDEPLQFYKKYGKEIKVSVDADRVNGVKKLLSETIKPSVVLLDDAFQHRKIKASFYIVLTKYDDLYVNDFLLPTGNLRESKRGVKRADVIIVTKCPEDLSSIEKKNLRKEINLVKGQRLFFSYIKYHDVLEGQEALGLETLIGEEILVVTGIASPKPFLQFLKEKGILYQHLSFSDHHHFSEEDIQRIVSVYEKITSSKKIILTTEKDYVRLEQKITNLYYLPIQSAFLEGSKEFDSLINEHIAYFYE